MSIDLPLPVRIIKTMVVCSHHRAVRERSHVTGLMASIWEPLVHAGLECTRTLIAWRYCNKLEVEALYGVYYSKSDNTHWQHNKRMQKLNSDDAPNYSSSHNKYVC